MNKLENKKINQINQKYKSVIIFLFLFFQFYSIIHY